jgi:tetratricopeptide (TPR) repeat protein
MIRQEWLDELWDFDDPAASEVSLRDGVAVLQTQVARALGLQDRFTEADAVLDAVDGVPDRVLLERGRLLNSSGNPTAAIPVFTAAVDAAGSRFLRVDALHMLAIADPQRADEHTKAALAEVERAEDDRTRRWGVALHNNLGWTHFNDGRFDEALDEFELALEAAVAYGTPAQQTYAAEAVDDTLRELGRA